MKNRGSNRRRNTNCGKSQMNGNKSKEMPVQVREDNYKVYLGSGGGGFFLQTRIGMVVDKLYSAMRRSG